MEFKKYEFGKKLGGIRRKVICAPGAAAVPDPVAGQGNNEAKAAEQ